MYFVMELICCSETSANYKPTLRNNPKERRSNVYRGGGSLKLHYIFMV
jgi:hypothetical protein